MGCCSIKAESVAAQCLCCLFVQCIGGLGIGHWTLALVGHWHWHWLGIGIGHWNWIGDDCCALIVCYADDLNAVKGRVVIVTGANSGK